MLNAVPPVFRLGHFKAQWRQQVDLLKDPNTKGTELSMSAQYSFGMRLFSSVNTTLRIIDEMAIVGKVVIERTL